MNENNLQQEVVLTALNNMVRKGYFDICTVDSCADILGVQVRGSEQYKLLRALHCIHFAEMLPNIRRAVPELVKQCLNLESLPLFEETPKNSIWKRLVN